MDAGYSKSDWTLISTGEQNLSHLSSSSNHSAQPMQNTTLAEMDLEMMDTSSGKRQGAREANQPKKNPTPNVSNSFLNLRIQDIWLGFLYMESLAVDLKIEPVIYSSEICLQASISQEETRELLSSLIAFPRIQQRLWPFF